MLIEILVKFSIKKMLAGSDEIKPIQTEPKFYYTYLKTCTLLKGVGLLYILWFRS